MEADVLFETLAGRWETLTELEKNAVSTAMAGVRQAEIWRAFMNNFSRAQELGEIALNSNGSAAEKFSVYMESLQAKVNQFKAAWSSLVYSESAVNFFGDIIDLGTQLLKLLKKLINNELVQFAAKVALMAVALGALSKAFGAIKALNIPSIFSEIMSAFAGVTFQTNMIAGATDAAALAFSKLGAAAKLSIAALVATAAVHIWQSAMTANEKYIESLDEVIAKRKEAMESYAEEILELESLQSAVKDTNGDKEKLLELSGEIRDVLGDNIDIYRSEEEAYKAINAQLEKQIQLKKDKLKFEEEEQKRDLAKKYEEEQYHVKLGPFTTANYDQEEVADKHKEAVEWVAYYDKKLEEISQKEYDNPMSKWVDEGMKNDLQRWRDDTQDEIDGYVEHLEKKFSQALPLLTDDLYDFASSSEVKEVGRELIRSLVYSGDYDTIDKLKEKFEEMTPELTEINDMIVKFKNNLGEPGNLDLLTSIVDKLNDMKETFPQSEDAINSVIDSLSGLTDAAEQTTEAVTKSAEQIQKEYEEAAESMSDLISNIQDHGKAIQEVTDSIAENGYLTTENMNTILDMYPQLTDAVAEYIMGLRDEASILQELNQAYQEDKNNAARALQEKMLNNETFWKTTILGNSQLIQLLSEQYNIDLTNYKGYNELKKQSEDDMIAVLEKYSDDYTTFLKDKYGEDSTEFQAWNTDKENGTLQAINNMKNKWGEFFAWLKGSYADSMVTIQQSTTLSPLQKGLEGIKNLAGGILDKLGAGARALVERAFNASDALNEINNVSFGPAEMGINSLASSLGNVSSAAKEAENAMDKLVDMVVKMLKKDAENDKKFFQKKIKDAQDAYNKQKKLLQREYQDRKKALQKEQKERKRALDDWYKARKKALEDSYKATHDALEKEKEEEIDAIEERIDTYERLIDAKLKALEKAESERSYKNEEAKKVKEIADLENKLAESRNDTSVEGIKNTLKLEEELAKKKEELAEFQHDYSVEQQKDALQDELDRYKQLLEDQKEAMEKNYDERLEAMENAHDKEMDLLEEEKEARERALEDWYDAQTEALENWYQAEQDRLDADLERTKDHYNKQIELVDEYLDQEGLLRQQAQDMILNDAEATLQKLLE